jgi:hypothetical protein
LSKLGHVQSNLLPKVEKVLTMGRKERAQLSAGVSAEVVFHADLFRDLPGADFFEKRGQRLGELLCFTSNIRTDEEKESRQHDHDQRVDYCYSDAATLAPALDP